MNKSNLQSIFNKYIENFEMLNNEKNDETYKWDWEQLQLTLGTQTLVSDIWGTFSDMNTADARS